MTAKHVLIILNCIVPRANVRTASPALYDGRCWKCENRLSPIADSRSPATRSGLVYCQEVAYCLNCDENTAYVYVEKETEPC